MVACQKRHQDGRRPAWVSLSLTSPSLGTGGPGKARGFAAQGRHVTLRGLVCLSVLRLHFTDDTAALAGCLGYR